MRCTKTKPRESTALCNVVSALMASPKPYNAKRGKTMTSCRFAGEATNDTNQKITPVFPP
jgi:hypothetical protein